MYNNAAEFYLKYQFHTSGVRYNIEQHLKGHNLNATCILTLQFELLQGV